MDRGWGYVERHLLIPFLCYQICTSKQCSKGHVGTLLQLDWLYVLIQCAPHNTVYIVQTQNRCALHTYLRSYTVSRRRMRDVTQCIWKLFRYFVHFTVHSPLSCVKTSEMPDAVFTITGVMSGGVSTTIDNTIHGERSGHGEQNVCRFFINVILKRINLHISVWAYALFSLFLVFTKIVFCCLNVRLVFHNKPRSN